MRLFGFVNGDGAPDPLVLAAAAVALKECRTRSEFVECGSNGSAASILASVAQNGCAAARNAI